MNKIKAIKIMLIIIVLYFNCTGYAQMIELSLHELCSNSSDIITARIIDKKSFKDNVNSRIYTEVVIKITNTVKGSLKSGETIKMIRFGGTYEGITTFIAGAPTFSVGEETLLFLQNRDQGYSIVGSSQGKYNIFVDKNKNDKEIFREQISTPLCEEKNFQKILITNSQSKKLTDFLVIVKKYVN